MIICGCCGAANYALRKKTFINGVVHFVHQCLSCGKNLGAVAKATVSCDAQSSLDPFDETLSDTYYEEQRIARERNRLAEDEAKRQRYAQYLLSPEWRSKRDKVLARDRNLCQGCLTKRAITVHHLSYEHIFDELFFELTSLCAECHNSLHSDRPPMPYGASLSYEAERWLRTIKRATSPVSR